MSEHTNEIEKRLIAYSLGELTPEEREAVEADLAAHPELAGEYGAVIAELKNWAGDADIDEPLDREVLDVAIAEAEGRQETGKPIIQKVVPPRRWTGSLALIAALAVVAVCAGFIVHRLTQENEAPPAPQPQIEVSEQQLMQARQQLELTLIYIGQVGGRSAATVVEEAVVSGVVPPLQKAARDVLDTQKDS